MIISDYFHFNNENLIVKLKEYIKTNPCCNKFLNCEHPKYQSDPNLFDLKNSDVEFIKNNYLNFLLKILNKKSLEFIENIAWVYLMEKNKEIKECWHSHMNPEYTDKNRFIFISGILYITETNIGTKFKTKFLDFEIKPHTNRWFLWESDILHTPKNMISNDDRIIIATSTIIKK